MLQSIGDLFVWLLRSKKINAMMAALLVLVLKRLGVDISDAEALMTVSVIVSYILGQGLADIGKERIKIERGDP